MTLRTAEDYIPFSRFPAHRVRDVLPKIYLTTARSRQTGDLRLSWASAHYLHEDQRRASSSWGAKTCCEADDAHTEADLFWCLAQADLLFDNDQKIRPSGWVKWSNGWLTMQSQPATEHLYRFLFRTKAGVARHNTSQIAKGLVRLGRHQQHYTARLSGTKLEKPDIRGRINPIAVNA